MTDQQWVTTSAGISIPPIIYGTAWKKERTADLVLKAIRAGFRGIDTAGQPKHYNEPLIGEALLRLKDHGIERENVFLQTKFTPLSGQDPQRLPYDKSSPIELQVAQSFETSKRNLQTNYLDAFILHSPLAPHELLMKTWKAMEKIHKAGSTRLLGISNCYNLQVFKSLYSDAKVKPAIVQNRFYQETGYDEDLRAWCAAHGVIYQSFWTLTANPHILISNPVKTIAQNLHKTAAQIFFRYLTQCGIVPLTGTTSAQHMREDLEIFDFQLSSDDLKNVGLLLLEKPGDGHP